MFSLSRQISAVALHAQVLVSADATRNPPFVPGSTRVRVVLLDPPFSGRKGAVPVFFFSSCRRCSHVFVDRDGWLSSCVRVASRSLRASETYFTCHIPPACASSSLVTARTCSAIPLRCATRVFSHAPPLPAAMHGSLRSLRPELAAHYWIASQKLRLSPAARGVNALHRLQLPRTFALARPAKACAPGSRRSGMWGTPNPALQPKHAMLLYAFIQTRQHCGRREGGSGSLRARSRTVARVATRAWLSLVS